MNNPETDWAVATRPRTMENFIDFLRHDLWRDSNFATLSSCHGYWYVKALCRISRNDADEAQLFTRCCHRMPVFDGTSHDGNLCFYRGVHCNVTNRSPNFRLERFELDNPEEGKRKRFRKR